MAENRYALVVANSSYLDPNLRKLTAPVFDAVALAKVLRDPEVGRFELTAVKNKESYPVQVALEKFCAGRNVDDTLLIYFSGHGLKDDAGNLYLAARNTTQGLLKATGISDTFLREVMKSCRARRQVLILDCCFGGAFANGLLAKAAENKTVEVNERFQGQGRVILTASNAMEFAFEGDVIKGEPPLSVFTRTLIHGLRSGEADLDGDGQISVQDLYHFAHRRIALPGSRQTPTISSVGQEGEIILANVPKTARARIRPAPLGGGGRTAGIRSLDLRPWVRIRDQGAEGANPAIAAVTALETNLALRGIDARLSARYVYQKAKQLRKQSQESDSGMDMETLVRTVREFGAPLEEDWPYVAGKWQLPKGKTWKALDEKAQKYRARLIPVTTPEEIRLQLANGRPVLGSFRVYESNWYRGDSAQRGVIEAPRAGEGDPPLGTIALVIVDFDEARDVIHFAHTWGATWGKLGFGEMTTKTAQTAFAGEEMWAVESYSNEGFNWEATTRLGHPVHSSYEVSPTPVALLDVEESDSVDDVADATRTDEVKEHPAPRRTRPDNRAGLKRAVFNAENKHENWSRIKLPVKSLARVEGDQPTGDRAVDETYDALGRFDEFFRKIYSRNSWNGQGAPYEAVVHYGRNFENAYWDGRRVVIGDGGQFFHGFHQVDIVAKELSMGLVRSLVNLPYEGQTGALFNSLALVFASLVKQYSLDQKASEADWLVGQGLLVEGKALVSLEFPGTAYDNAMLGKDPQVGHMANYLTTTDDNGGVHINCGIPNRAFVLIARALGGNAWDRAGRIWYDAVCSGRLKKTATFAQFAQLTHEIAKKNYSAAIAKAVREGWAEVGIKGV